MSSSDEDEIDYQVDRILDIKLPIANNKNEIQYYIRWIGFDEDYDSWEPEDCLGPGCFQLIKEFLESINKPRIRKRWYNMHLGEPEIHLATDQDETSEKNEEEEEQEEQNEETESSNSSEEVDPSSSDFVSPKSARTLLKDKFWHDLQFSNKDNLDVIAKVCSKRRKAAAKSIQKTRLQIAGDVEKKTTRSVSKGKDGPKATPESASKCRGRGRPRKRRVSEEDEEETAEISSQNSSEQTSEHDPGQKKIKEVIMELRQKVDKSPTKTVSEPSVEKADETGSSPANTCHVNVKSEMQSPISVDLTDSADDDKVKLEHQASCTIPTCPCHEMLKEIEADKNDTNIKQESLSPRESPKEHVKDIKEEIKKEPEFIPDDPMKMKSQPPVVEKSHIAESIEAVLRGSPIVDNDESPPPSDDSYTVPVGEIGIIVTCPSVLGIIPAPSTPVSITTSPQSSLTPSIVSQIPDSGRKRGLLGSPPIVPKEIKSSLSPDTASRRSQSLLATPPRKEEEPIIRVEHPAFLADSGRNLVGAHTSSDKVSVPTPAKVSGSARSSLDQSVIEIGTRTSTSTDIEGARPSVKETPTVASKAERLPAPKPVQKESPPKPEKDSESAQVPAPQTETRDEVPMDICDEQAEPISSRPAFDKDLPMKVSVDLSLSDYFRENIKAREDGKAISPQDFHKMCLHRRLDYVRQAVAAVHSSRGRYSLNTNIPDNQGKTIMLILCSRACDSTHADDDVLEYLSMIDTDVNYHNRNNGMTALHYAVDASALCKVKKLISLRAIVNVTNNRGYTPLMLAARAGKIQILQYLLDVGGADFSAIVNENQDTASPSVPVKSLTAYQLAVSGNQKRCAEIIAEHMLRVKEKIDESLKQVLREIRIKREICPVHCFGLWERNIVEFSFEHQKSLLPNDRYGYVVTIGVAKINGKEVMVRFWGQCPVDVVTMNGQELEPLQEDGKYLLITDLYDGTNTLTIKLVPKAKETQMKLVVQILLMQLNKVESFNDYC